MLNRGVGRRVLFTRDEDFLAFERIVEETLRTRRMRLCAYWRTFMAATRQVDAAPLVSLLRRAAPHNAENLEKLLSELAPIFMLESGEESILFKSRLNPPTIIVGVKCTCRLQAHAFAGGIFLSALSTPGYLQMSPEQRGRLYAPADPLLTWAVGRDLQQWINQRFEIERGLHRSGSDRFRSFCGKTSKSV